MSVSFDCLDPDLRQGLKELLQFCAYNDLKATVTSTCRSRREQQFLWNRYQKGQAFFPAAKPGHSAHEYGWAFDLLISPPQYQAAVGDAWVQFWGGAYGGVKDAVHFELPGASATADDLGNKADAEAADSYPSLWDYIGWTLSFSSLQSLLFELGYTAASQTEAEKIARALHLDPQGHEISDWLKKVFL